MHLFHFGIHSFDLVVLVLDFQLNSSYDISKLTLVLRLKDCYLILDILLLNIL